jgi:biotin carboxylase
VTSLLVLGAGIYYVHAIEEVRAAGYRAVVVDRNPAAPGLAIADAPHVIDLADPDAVLDVARAEAVAGVMALNDFGVPTAARVADALSLPGITLETAALACDKGLMRERWARDGLTQPEFAIAYSPEEARTAASRLGPPIVVKPADSGGGGRGVSVVHALDELAWAYAFAAPFARNGRILVERYLDGTEMTVETVSYRGEVHVLASSDKIKPPLRTRVATRLTYPPALEGTALDEVHELAQKAVISLGLADGPGHVELIVTDQGPHLVEMGARGGGGHVFSRIVEVVSGVPMVRESAHVLAGGRPDLRPRRRRGCVYELFVPQNGVIRAIRGVEQARAIPGVLELGITREPGDTVGELLDSLQRSGYAVVCGHDRAEAISRADSVVETVVFELDRPAVTYA